MTFMDQIGKATIDISANTSADAVVLALLRTLPFKLGVQAATTSNVTLATALVAGQAIDSITLVAGDRVLLAGQTTGSQNGIYVVQASGAAVRALDFDEGAELCGSYIPVIKGTTNAGKLFKCTNTTCTVGTTAITIAEKTFAT